MPVSSLPGRRAGLLMLLIAVILLATALPGYAQDDAIASRVNGDAITQAAFHARVRFVRWQYLRELEKIHALTGGSPGVVRSHIETLVGLLQDPVALGDAVLAQMEEDRLLWQTGASLGVIPAAEDVQELEARFFSLWTGVDAADVPTDATAQAFIAVWYAEAMDVSGMNADAIYDVFATEVLRDRLFDVLAAGIPTEELAVHSRHILCSFHPQNVSSLAPPTTEERAVAETCIRTARARLDAGESFSQVAADLSTDRFSATSGGDLGWILISRLVEDYADAVRDADLNTLIGPVETPFGLHLVEVLERRMQPLTQADLLSSQQGYFELWIATLRAEAALERDPQWAEAVPSEPGLDTLDPDVLAAVNALLGQP